MVGSWMALLLFGLAAVAVEGRSNDLKNWNSSSGGMSGKLGSRFGVLADLQKGDVHDAVAHLKVYLAKLGYIPPDKHEDLSVEFDELMEEAIKLYQLNFNLAVTGSVDQETLRLLHTPRCGREDVVDGRPLMVPRGHSNEVGLPRTIGGRHENLESNWAVFAPSEKWQSSHNLSYGFSSMDIIASLPEEDAKAAISAAFATWSTVIPVNFTQISNFSAADIQVMFVGGDHGDGDPFDGRLGILAHSFAPEDGRFHFDSDEVWTVNVMETADEDAIDLQTVALHEIGHLLGLAHTQVEGAVMYPSIVCRQVKRQLTRDDVQGAQALYGSKYRRPLTTACDDRKSDTQYGFNFGSATDSP